MNKNKSGLAYLKKSMMAVPFFQAGEDRYCQAFLIFVFFHFRIFFFGGSTDGKNTSRAQDTYQLNRASNTWEYIGDMGPTW